VNVPEDDPPFQPFDFLEVWWSFFICYPSVGQAGRKRAQRFRVGLKSLRFIENLGLLLVVLITGYVADSRRFDFWDEHGLNFRGTLRQFGLKEFCVMLLIAFVVHGWIATPLQTLACRFARWVNE